MKTFLLSGGTRAHEIMRFCIFKRVIWKDHARTISNRCSGSDASYRVDGQEKLWAAGKRTNPDGGGLSLLKVDIQAD